MDINLSGKPIRDAVQAEADISALGYPPPARFRERANTLWNPLGRGPARGWVLMTREDLDALDVNARQALSFTDELAPSEWYVSSYGGISQTSATTTPTGIQGTAVALHGLVITGTDCVTPGQPDDPAALYMVEVADARWLCHNPFFHVSANKQYNVRAPGWGGSYYDDSRNSGSDWTWSTMVADLWALLTPLGSYPGLPFTPDGTPENYRFTGVSAWQALCDVLDRIGCAVRCDLTAATGQYTIVRVGSADAAATSVLEAAETRKIFDRDVSEPTLARVPYGVRVFFHRTSTTAGSEDTTAKDSSQWTTAGPYKVDVVGPDSSTAEAGLYHPLWDDLPALYDETGTLANTLALATRAQERSDDFYRMLRSSGGTRLHRVYAGILPIQPSSIVKAVRFGQCDWPTPDVRTVLAAALDDAQKVTSDGYSPTKFLDALESGLRQATAAGGLVTEVVRSPWQFVTIDDEGRCCPAGAGSSSLKPPDYNPTFPVYPHLGQVIRVNNGTASGTLFDSYVQRCDSVTSPTWTDRERVWAIELSGLTSMSTGTYLGRLVGYSSSRPVYAVKSASVTATISVEHLSGGSPITGIDTLVLNDTSGLSVDPISAGTPPDVRLAVRAGTTTQNGSITTTTQGIAGVKTFHNDLYTRGDLYLQDVSAAFGSDAYTKFTQARSGDDSFYLTVYGHSSAGIPNWYGEIHIALIGGTTGTFYVDAPSGATYANLNFGNSKAAGDAWFSCSGFSGVSGTYAYPSSIRVHGGIVTAITASTRYSDEEAQDAVGGIVTSSSSITLTYSDGTPSITADVASNGITNAMLRDSSATSLMGRGTNSSGDPGDIAATAGSGAGLLAFDDNSDTLVFVQTGSAARAPVSQSDGSVAWQAVPILVSAPGSASATGTAGQIAYDSSYIYICVATDTWLRAPIATW